MKPRTILVVHQERLAAEGIAAGLARYPTLVPVGVATRASEAESFAGRVEAVAIDARLAAVERAARHLRDAGARVVLIRSRSDGGQHQPDEGGVSVGIEDGLASLAAALVPEARGLPQRNPAVDRLTGRERDVLRFAARGMAGKQIATTLGISPKTVEQHKTRAFRRLGVPNQAAAVALIARGGR